MEINQWEILVHPGFVWVTIASLVRLKKCRRPQHPFTLPKGRLLRRNDEAGRGTQY
jgi:hypothetical protein